MLSSWQGDDAVQFVELRMVAAGQGGLAGAGLVIDDADGVQRVFLFAAPVTRAVENARILIGTRALVDLTNQEPDFILEPGMLPRDAGRVCYVTAVQTEANVIDCVSYGRFPGSTLGFGTATPVTPDNRSLHRVDLTGDNRADWQGNLTPTPETNRGAGFQLATLCGNAQVNQGEQCDGANLVGKDCTDFGFASGKLRCRQCHVDTARCSLCGNGALNGKAEQCDGTELRGKTCAALGFTGGTLECSQSCKLSTTGCDPTFFVPGGGPPASDCLAEWRVTNAAARPGGDGRALTRQKCKDGDAGCDADVASGTCTFTVAVCLAREDARLGKCARGSVESWTLLAPDAATDADTQARLVGGVAGLGPSSSADGAVIFSPALDATERCTDSLSVVVPTRGTRPVRSLKARTVAAGGRPRDVDTLKLVCTP